MDDIGIMLVDDEILVIETIRDITDWASTSFVIVAEALTGKDAIVKFRKYTPQIVILDISIPDMNGLQIAKSILKESPATQIILLTSYETFEFAREAVNIGASTYMLKHDLCEQSLLAVLNTAKDQWFEAALRNSAQKRILLQSYLNGSIRHSKYMLQSLFDDVGGRYAVILMKRAHPILEEFQNRTEHYGTADFIMRSITAADALAVPIEAADMAPNITAMLIRIKQQPSRIEERRELYELAALVGRFYRNKFGNSIYSIISACSGDPDKIRIEYGKCLELSKYCMFFDKEFIIFTDECICRVSNESEHLLLNLDPDLIYKSFVNTRREEDISHIIKKIFQKTFSDGWSLNNLKNLCSALLIVMKRIMDANGLSDLYLKNLFSAYSPTYTVKELEKWFAVQFTNMYCLSVEKYSEKVQNAIRELRKRYSENITTQIVADIIGISEVYLRTLLKKETGMTFLEHLTMFRIEIAKILLMDDKYRIYEIANMVGYHDISYFSRLFKKMTGSYPPEYRNKENYG